VCGTYYIRYGESCAGKLQPELNKYLLGIRLYGVTSVFREYQCEIEKEDKSIEEAALVLKKTAGGKSKRLAYNIYFLASATVVEPCVMDSLSHTGLYRYILLNFVFFSKKCLTYCRVAGTLAKGIWYTKPR